MSDYEEDFEDVDDIVADDNELNSPVRDARTKGKETGFISSGGGADGKGASAATVTQRDKKSSKLRETCGGGRGTLARALGEFEDLLRLNEKELLRVIIVCLCSCTCMWCKPCLSLYNCRKWHVFTMEDCFSWQQSPPHPKEESCQQDLL